ncbi:hypothetical protein AGLY_004134 [Aphis glycines]|uniref:Uncharacterized protein n=1 Tax=Aphis glycines TaxID=307491 RepID=A0A6G0TX69_APHGL|nr:hypothetical protein AGLY_004134 [Aphis glycines]
MIMKLVALHSGPEFSSTLLNKQCNATFCALHLARTEVVAAAHNRARAFVFNIFVNVQKAYNVRWTSYTPQYNSRWECIFLTLPSILYSGGAIEISSLIDSDTSVKSSSSSSSFKGTTVSSTTASNTLLRTSRTTDVSSDFEGSKYSSAGVDSSLRTKSVSFSVKWPFISVAEADVRILLRYVSPSVTRANIVSDMDDKCNKSIDDIIVVEFITGLVFIESRDE